jgi:Poly-beta-hydroxybutyrate polymerase N terminal
MNIRPETVVIRAASGGTETSSSLLAALPGDLNAVVSPVLAASQWRGQEEEVAPASRNLPTWISTQDIDRAVRAGIARLTAGLAPSALAGVFFDWIVHLAASPGKRLELVGQAWSTAIENAIFASRCAAGAPSDPQILCTRWCSVMIGARAARRRWSSSISARQTFSHDKDPELTAQRRIIECNYRPLTPILYC